MSSKRKLTIYKVAVLLIPFLIGFIFLRVFGENIYRWRKLSTLGEDSIVETSHYYTIFSHKDPNYEHLKTIIDDFTMAFYKEYRDKFKLKDFSKRVSIMLLKNDAELQKYAERQLQQDLTFNDGYYNPIKAEIAIVMRDNMVVNLKGLFHEITHAIFDQSAELPEWSYWLSEGLATYFAESRIENSTIELGRLNEEYHKVVKNLIKNPEYFIPLGKLLEANPAKFTSEENTYYYAESHTLIYFLYEWNDGKYRDKLYQYILEEKKPGVSSPFKFEAIIGNINEIEKEWIKFIEDL